MVIDSRPGRSVMRFGLPLLFMAVLGCAAVVTRTKFYAPVTADVKIGNFQGAVDKFESEKKNFGDKDRLLYFLDSGALYHYVQNYELSNTRLSLAETAAEELFTRSVSRAGASLLLNDNTLEYAGEDYEILYTNLLKALNFMALHDFDDAFIEIKRSNLKLQLLEQKYAEAATIMQRGLEKDSNDLDIDYAAEKVRFNNSAFARYMSMHMYAADGKFDDAHIDRNLLMEAFETQPHIYDFPVPETRFAADSGALISVVGFTGLCPIKEAMNLRLRTDKQLGLVQVLYTDSENNESEYGHLPINVDADFYFKFAIPKLAARESPVHSIRVFADSIYLGELGLLEDLSKIALETFKAKSSLIYVRSVARALAKGIAANQLKKKVDSGGVGGWIKKAAIDVGTDIIENADLRCARFLPGKIYVGDFVLQPGIYDIRVEFLDMYGGVINVQSLPKYEINKGGLNLIRTLSLELATKEANIN